MLVIPSETGREMTIAHLVCLCLGASCVENDQTKSVDTTDSWARMSRITFVCARSGMSATMRSWIPDQSRSVVVPVAVRQRSSPLQPSDAYQSASLQS